MVDVDRRRKVRKYTFRGKELDELVTLKDDNVIELFRSRIRRKLRRKNGFKGKYLKFMQKVINSKVNLQPGQRPKMIRTHLRSCIVMPKMVGAVVGVYNGKEYREVDIKFDMIGRYLGEFSLTYKPTLRRMTFGDKKPAEKKP